MQELLSTMPNNTDSTVYDLYFFKRLEFTEFFIRENVDLE